jgi:hypothetical protein
MESFWPLLVSRRKTSNAIFADAGDEEPEIYERLEFLEQSFNLT